MTIPPPNLIPLDLSKAVETEHPDVECGKTYLCLINNIFYLGKFRREWFGLSFDGGNRNHQFAAPGHNSSNWQAIWEVQAELPEMSPSDLRRHEAISEVMDKEPAYAGYFLAVYRKGGATPNCDPDDDEPILYEVPIPKVLWKRYPELDLKTQMSFEVREFRGYTYITKLKAE